tara:strand:+ start:1302 stop:1961 length:660 start_codon:yes stop_codon:yes gene_type:complete
MKKKFAWEKWFNPLDEELESIKNEVEDLMDEAPNMFAEEEDIQHQVFPIIQQPPPFGLVSAINEQNRFINSFDFWIMHTNFDVTEDIKSLIEKTPGVESITVLTRYRVKIGLTRSGLFNNTQVKQLIQNKIIALDSKSKAIQEEYLSDIIFDTPTQEMIEKTKQDLGDSDCKYWSFYVFPNGQLSVEQVESKDELDEKVQFFQTVEYLIGGKVFYSTAE